LTSVTNAIFLHSYFFSTVSSRSVGPGRRRAAAC
jgi:hypothetical protein